MADALEYLNNLIYRQDTMAGKGPLKPPKLDVAAVEAVARGDMPSGVDLEAILLSALEAQNAPQPDTSGLEEEIMGAVTFASTNRAQLQELANQFSAAGQREFEAFSAVQDVTAESAILQASRDINFDGNIRNLLAERDMQRDSTVAAYNSQAKQLQEDMEVVQNAEAIDVMDFIADPLNYMQTIVDRNAAKDRVAAGLDRLNALDAQEQFNARTTQEETADINIARTLKDRNDLGLITRNIEANKALQIASAGKQLTVDNFSMLKETLNINNTALGNMVTGLNALQEKGKLTQQRMQNALTTAQVVSMNAQTEQQRKLIERDEAVRELFDYRIGLAATALGVEDVVRDYDTFLAAKEAGLLPVETLSSISYAMSVGVLDSRAIFSSSKPMATARNLLSTDASLMTPDIKNLVARASSIVYDGRNSAQSTPGYQTMSLPEQELEQDNALKRFYENAKRDGDLYVQNSLLTLNSPHLLDYSPGKGMDSITPAAAAILKKTRVDGRDLNIFARDLAGSIADAVRNGSVGSEEMAVAAAQVMTMHAQDLRNRTGLGTEGLIATKFMSGRDAGPVDLTNPVAWKNRIEQMVAANKVQQLIFHVDSFGIPQ